jgi:hypothetical protein
MNIVSDSSFSVRCHIKQKHAKLFQLAHKIAENNKSFDFESSISFKWSVRGEYESHTLYVFDVKFPCA